MNIPKTGNGSYILIRAEKETGIILNNNNSRYSNVGDNDYMSFSSIELLELYIDQQGNLNNYEYLIYDENAKFFKIIKEC